MAEMFKFKVFVRVGWDADGDRSTSACSAHDPCELGDGIVDTSLPFRDYEIEITAPFPMQASTKLEVTLPAPDAERGPVISAVAVAT